MNILVLNCGSSSIKYKLYEMESRTTITKGGIEKIGLKDAFLQFKTNGEKRTITQPIPNHTQGIQLILNTLCSPDYGCLQSIHQLDAVGHRVVHGGSLFNQSVLVTPEVLQNIAELSTLAPLHNPANLKGIEAIQSILGNIPQVVVFDTAFHQTMPPHAYLYPLPYRYYTDYKVRKYGFHGTSHRYVAQRACEFLHLDPQNSKIITAHIGNGGSITAVVNGQSIDTTMGLTPCEGLMMGTRVGDIDAGAITYIMDKEKITTQQMSNIINKESGIKGVSELSSDMRDIEQAIAQGNQRATLTREMYNYRIVKHIGAMIAAMNGVDAIIFTGGVGENRVSTRQYVCQHLSYLGLDYNPTLNEQCFGEEMELSTPQSTVKVAVIPTDEEWMIASDTMRLCQ